MSSALPWTTMFNAPQKIYAYVRLYRVAPKACTSKNALASIVACTHELNASGIGLEIGMSRTLCHQCSFRHNWPDCATCKAREKARQDRIETAKAVSKKFKLTEWRNGHSLFRSAYLHICRGVATEEAIKRARTARKNAAEMLRERGYEVHLTDDEGGTRKLSPKKRRQHARR